MGGADSFISRLPDKYSTYLEPPVRDHYSYQPEGTKSASGAYVDFSRVREAAGISVADGGGGVGNRGVSGGQMQRIALYVMFICLFRIRISNIPKVAHVYAVGCL